MSVTALKGVTEIYKILKTQNLGISGGIYKYRRPINSTKEDIVINSLPITNGYMQKGTYNVNCYVQNIHGMPNTSRLEEIANKVQSILKEYWGEDYVLYIENSQTFEEENQMYYNFRIRLNIIKK